MTNDQLIEDNRRLLQSLHDLLYGLDDSVYTCAVSDHFRSTIGTHVRHIIDHYDRYLDGLNRELLNYDSRLRETVLENNRLLACQRIASLLEELIMTPAIDKPVRVIVDLSTTGSGEIVINSRLSRELAFLHSHTTHHHASIAMILSALNIELPEAAFGLAPGTLRHIHAQKSRSA